MIIERYKPFEFSTIIKSVPREFLIHSEYRLFSTELLLSSYKQSLSESTENKDIIIAAYEKEELCGYTQINYSSFDSTIFGFEMYTIQCFVVYDNIKNNYDKIIQKLIDNVLDFAKERKIRHLSLSLNSNNALSPKILTRLIQNKFYFINTLFTFSLVKDQFSELDLNKYGSDDITVSKSRIEDTEQIMKIAQESFKLSRFHLDENLDNNKCDLLYLTSAKNSIQEGFADVVYVAKQNDKVLGYYSAKKRENKILNCDFGIPIAAAVSKSARKMGVFSMLNDFILKWYSSKADISEVGTYINNIPVHKTWTKNRLNIVRGSYQLAKYNS